MILRHASYCCGKGLNQNTNIPTTSLHIKCSHRLCLGWTIHCMPKNTLNAFIVKMKTKTITKKQKQKLEDFRKQFSSNEENHVDIHNLPFFYLSRFEIVISYLVESLFNWELSNKIKIYLNKDFQCIFFYVTVSFSLATRF